MALCATLTATLVRPEWLVGCDRLDTLISHPSIFFFTKSNASAISDTPIYTSPP
jgi:hypothetical protein